MSILIVQKIFSLEQPTTKVFEIKNFFARFDQVEKLISRADRKLQLHCESKYILFLPGYPDTDIIIKWRSDFFK